MKLKFEPEDFMQSALELGQLKHSRSTMARAAQVKFDAWLKEHGTVVYGHWFGANAPEYWGLTDNRFNDNHKAILICIEPLEKCKHPKEKVRPIERGLYFRCECGATVKAIAFEET